jgi:alpha-maltose-1-phosphate synthase
MKAVLAVNGVFHHFELARELAKRDLLECIYSTFPWKRLKREDLDRRYVRTFPWIHTPQIAAGRWVHIPPLLNRNLSRLARTTLDAHVARTFPACDVFVALSGSGVASGRQARRSGAKHICDRGSSHMRFQHAILVEEYRRWGYSFPQERDHFFLEREEIEYAEADAITVPSTFALRTFLEMGVPAEKLHRIPYGVRLERFQRTAEPPQDRFEVLFAGAVGLRKGVPYLLEAFRKLQHPRKRLRIAGAVQPEMKAFFRRQNLEHVEILGGLPQTKLIELMSTSHALVLPSIEDGFGLVMAQAMACGCPVVASTNTGAEDLFTDGVEGFIVPIRSPETIALRLQQLVDDPAFQQKMSHAAVQRVHQIGGWDQYGGAWATLLYHLTGMQPPRTLAVSV